MSLYKRGNGTNGRLLEGVAPTFSGLGEGVRENFFIFTIIILRSTTPLFTNLTIIIFIVIMVNMTNNFISSAYDSLNHAEKGAVDSYVQAVRIIAERNNELIIHSLSREIPADVIARSRGLLEKPLVKAAIHDKIQELSDNQDLAPKRILREHMTLAMSNMADYLEFSENGFFTINLAKCTRQQMAAVKRVKVEHGIFGTQVTIDLHDKKTHMDALTKMMGLDQPDNPVYLSHMAKPADIKPLEAASTPQEIERAYIELLEAIKA